MKCPKCGSEMGAVVNHETGRVTYWFCTNSWCGHEEKVGGCKCND